MRALAIAAPGGENVPVRSREERIGLNEAMFRDVNERIRALNADFAEISDVVDIVCECGRIDCIERIEMPPAEYEALRSDPTLFAIVAGHEIADVEDVVARYASYHVVRKRPLVPAEIARATDPRGG